MPVSAYPNNVWHLTQSIAPIVMCAATRKKGAGAVEICRCQECNLVAYIAADQFSVKIYYCDDHICYQQFF